MPEGSAPVGGIPFAPGSLPRHHMFRNRRSRIANAQLMDDINSSGLKRQGDPLLPEQSDWSPATPDEAVYGRSRSYTARGDRSTLEKTAHLAGRAIFGGYFLYNGINHFQNRQMLARHASSKKGPGADAAGIAAGGVLNARGLGPLPG